MNENKILIVDDDKNICEILAIYLQKEGFKTIEAYDGKAALNLFHIEKPSLVLLDIMLPEIDGWEILKEIRKSSDCPIIMISAKGEIFDKVLGLELGSDDYIVKPFESKEVVARVKAVLRRNNKEFNSTQKPNKLSYDKLIIDLETYELIVNDKKINTPPKELELIYCLASNPNHVLTRVQLLNEVWGFNYYGDSRTVDVHIKRLREKLDGVSNEWNLKTVWGVGYKFEVKSNDSK